MRVAVLLLKKQKRSARKKETINFLTVITQQYDVFMDWKTEKLSSFIIHFNKINIVNTKNLIGCLKFPKIRFSWISEIHKKIKNKSFFFCFFQKFFLLFFSIYRS